MDGYQAGSTFKIFTVVAALEKGIRSTTRSTPHAYRSGYRGASGAAACPGTDRYCPGNADDGMAGAHTCGAAFGRSVNTYFVPLQERVGADAVVDAARRLGIEFRSAGDAERARDRDAAGAWGSFTLGVSATTPLDLANAYATLAADGRHCEPIPVQRITDRTGQALAVAEPRCRRTVRAAVARAAIDAARCPVGDRSAYRRMPGRHRGRRPAGGRPPGCRQDRHHRRPPHRLAGRHDQGSSRSPASWPTRTGRRPPGTWTTTWSTRPFTGPWRPR